MTRASQLSFSCLLFLPRDPPESGVILIFVFGHDSTSKIWIWIDKFLRLPYEYSPLTPCLFQLHTSSLLMVSILLSTWLPKLSTSGLYLSFSFTIHIPWFCPFDVESVFLPSSGHCFSPGSGTWSPLPSSLSCTLIFPVHSLHCCQNYSSKPQKWSHHFSSSETFHDGSSLHNRIQTCECDRRPSI